MGSADVPALGKDAADDCVAAELLPLPKKSRMSCCLAFSTFVFGPVRFHWPVGLGGSGMVGAFFDAVVCAATRILSSPATYQKNRFAAAFGGGGVNRDQNRVNSPRSGL